MFRRNAFGVGPGIAVREYPTDIGRVDYVLFAGRRAIGVIEAKTQDWGTRLPRLKSRWKLALPSELVAMLRKQFRKACAPVFDTKNLR